jgi:hypothetical protein
MESEILVKQNTNPSEYTAILNEKIANVVAELGGVSYSAAKFILDQAWAKIQTEVVISL